MIQLTQGQMNYLLYAKAYAKAEEGETVTSGTVKSHLIRDLSTESRDVGAEVAKIHDFLLDNLLITLATKDGNPTKKNGRFCLTGDGNKALLYNLAQTNYKFTSSKGYKVLNTLLGCIQDTSNIHSQVIRSEVIVWDEFQTKFKELYFEERRQQEGHGVVTIYKKDLCQKFAEQNSISQKNVEQNFEILKANGEILVVTEKNVELVQWIE